MPDDNANELEILRNTNRELLEKAKQRKEKIAALEAELATAKTQADERVEAANARVESMMNGVHKQITTRIAQELFVNPALGLKVISDRIKLTLDDKGVKTIVLREDGSDSDLTLDAFKAELRKDKSLAGILIGSKAAGGGAARSQDSGSAVRFPQRREPPKVVQTFGLK